MVNPGDAATFVVNVSGEGGRELSYNWTVSEGTIESGQGTVAITVRTPLRESRIDLRATVTVGGLLTGCENIAAETASVAPRPECGLPPDQHGKISVNDEKAHLSNDAFFLKQNPNFVMSIILFLELRETRDAALRRRNRIQQYLVNVRNADPTKIKFYFAEGNETQTSFYLTTPEISDAPRQAFKATAKINDIRPTRRTAR